MYREKKLFALACFLFCQPASSVELTFGYSATILFDPDEVIGIGDQTTEEFFDNLVGEGAGATGELQVVGSFSWETDVTAFNSNQVSAAYVNAITGSTISLGRDTFTADTLEVEANAATSLIGSNTGSTAGFCASLTGCDAVNLNFAPTGSVIQVLNNASFSARNIITGDLISSSTGRDSFQFRLGFTDSIAEYTPVTSTEDFGQVNVGGVTSFFVSTAAASIFAGVSIPDESNFPEIDELEQATICLLYTSPSPRD